MKNIWEESSIEDKVNFLKKDTECWFLFRTETIFAIEKLNKDLRRIELIIAYICILNGIFILLVVAMFFSK